MKTYEVTIVGITSLLQHRFAEDAEVAKSTRKQLIKREEPRAAAERVVYRDKQNRFFHPGIAIVRALAHVGSNHKQRGNRKSLRFVIAGAVTVMEEAVLILNGDTKKLISNYEVDSRPVTIPSTKGRIMRHRPRFDNWSLKFTLRINDTLIEPDVVHELLDEAGLQSGLGDYRPACTGPFGQFLTHSWREIQK